MADRFQRLSTTSTTVLLAVKLLDALTGRALRAEATVRIEGVPETPTLNPSGYWLFLDPPMALPAAEVTITVDPPPEYARRTLTVDTSTLDPRGRWVELYPTPAYPLSPGRTVIEGRVEDADGEPVFGATITIEDTDTKTMTGDDGRFVLVLDDLATTESAGPDDVLRVDPTSEPPGEITVRPERGPPGDPTLVVEHDDYEPMSTTVELTEGDRLTLSSPLVLVPPN